MLVLLFALLCGAAKMSRVSSLGDSETCELTYGDTLVDVDVEDEVTHRMYRCRDRVRVKQCEGKCTSQVSPSVLNHGFDKKCNCCREHRFDEHRISITNCLDKLTGTSRAGFTHTVTIREPASCRCQLCDF